MFSNESWIRMRTSRSPLLSKEARTTPTWISSVLSELFPVWTGSRMSSSLRSPGVERA